MKSKAMNLKRVCIILAVSIFIPCDGLDSSCNGCESSCYVPDWAAPCSGGSAASQISCTAWGGIYCGPPDSRPSGEPDVDARCNGCESSCFVPGWAAPCSGGIAVSQTTCTGWEGIYCGSPANRPAAPTSKPEPNQLIPIESDVHHHRLIAYVENWKDCPSDAKINRYTHILVAFAVTYTYPAISRNGEIQDLPLCNQATTLEQTKALLKKWQDSGRKVIISFGGWNQNAFWSEVVARGIPDIVQQSKALVEKYGFDGLDIDFENSVFFDNFLSDYTIALKKAMPDKEISHVPMDSHLVSPNDNYFKQLVRAKNSLDFLMVQYYNGPIHIVGKSFEKSGAQAHYARLVSQVLDGDASRLVFGFCNGDCNAASYNIKGAHAVEIMKQIQVIYPNNGGAFFWASGFDDGAWNIGTPLNNYLKTFRDSDVSTKTPIRAAPTSAAPVARASSTRNPTKSVTPQPTVRIAVTNHPATKSPAGTTKITTSSKAIQDDSSASRVGFFLLVICLALLF